MGAYYCWGKGFLERVVSCDVVHCPADQERLAQRELERKERVMHSVSLGFGRRMQVSKSEDLERIRVIRA